MSEENISDVLPPSEPQTPEWEDVEPELDEPKLEERKAPEIKQLEFIEPEIEVDEIEDQDDGKKPTKARSGRKLSAQTTQIIRKVRGNWGSQLQYFVSSVGMAVGLGNLWRFPYICQQYGGGAFVIPFILSSVILGFPCFLLECSVGQFFQASFISLWKICPLLKGVGYLTFFVAFWTASYYMVILTWLAYYMIASLTIHELPWETCNNTWNTKKCLPLDCAKDNICNSTDRRTPSAEYWELKVTGKTEDVTKLGAPQWYLFALLLILWICTYLCLFRGIQWLGKIVTVVMIFPCVTIFILLIRSFFLPGALNGIWYLLEPDFEKLIEIAVWFEAATQVFFSYFVGFGAVIAYSSFNSFNTDIFMLSIAVCLCDTLFSFVFAFMIYAVIGFISETQHMPIEAVGQQGPELVFLVYPQALSLLPLAPLWAACFFFGVLVIGLTSQLALVESLISALEDEYDWFYKYRWLAILLLATAIFIPGVAMVTGAGIYYVDFLDHYGGAGWAVLTEIFIELVGISYCYGAARLEDNIRAMIGYSIPGFIKYFWKYISPSILLIILLLSPFQIEFVGRKSGFFPWVDYCGVALSISSIAWVPGYMIYRILREKGSYKERIKRATAPEKQTVVQPRRQSTFRRSITVPPPPVFPSEPPL